MHALAPDVQGSYKGTPYEDSRYKGGAQAVPGRVQCVTQETSSPES